jgi:HEPN domain-containing protein
MSKGRRVASLLALAGEDVEAAKVLSQAGNRYAAYHCQQALEKLIKALLLRRDIESGVEHRLDVLMGKIPNSDPWKAVLRPLDIYTPYATTFRYPTPGGRIPSAPPADETHADAEQIAALIERAREEPN